MPIVNHFSANISRLSIAIVTGLTTIAAASAAEKVIPWQ